MADFTAAALALFHDLYDAQKLVAIGGYFGLALIVFAETGLFFGFIFPGDSLLISLGLFCATGQLDIVTLNLFLIPAAIIGDAVGYMFGARVGRRLYSRKDSILFKQDHVRRAHAFYEKHGGKAIVFARFIPVVRSFAPIVAGIAEMPYPKFAMFNIVGAALWVAGITLLGYFLGRSIPNIQEHLLLVISIVVFLSFLPVIKEYWDSRHQHKAAGAAKGAKK